jgi:glycosyltransferase involved in cell wall biosynthesis
LNFYKVTALHEMIKACRELKIDLVHNNLNWRGLMFSDVIDCPMISTIHHIRLQKPGERETYSKFKNANYISISNAQRKSLPDVNWIKTIYNGIDVSTFTFKEQKQDYFVFLGRISPEKGVAELCQMIQDSPYTLKIAARINEPDRPYYEEKVKPLIDGKKIEYVGEVDLVGKNEIVSNAKALLQWSNWDEPFGLTVVEAMACGTPVVVNDRGAMNEIVENGKTGFVVTTLDEMKEKLAEVGTLSPKASRTRVEEYFSIEKMTSEYIALVKSFEKK